MYLLFWEKVMEEICRKEKQEGLFTKTTEKKNIYLKYG